MKSSISIKIYTVASSHREFIEIRSILFCSFLLWPEMDNISLILRDEPCFSILLWRNGVNVLPFCFFGRCRCSSLGAVDIDTTDFGDCIGLLLLLIGERLRSLPLMFLNIERVGLLFFIEGRLSNSANACSASSSSCRPILMAVSSANTAFAL